MDFSEEAEVGTMETIIDVDFEEEETKPDGLIEDDEKADDFETDEVRFNPIECQICPMFIVCCVYDPCRIANDLE